MNKPLHDAVGCRHARMIIFAAKLKWAIRRRAEDQSGLRAYAEHAQAKPTSQCVGYILKSSVRKKFANKLQILSVIRRKETRKESESNEAARFFGYVVAGVAHKCSSMFWVGGRMSRSSPQNGSTTKHRSAVLTSSSASCSFSP